MRVLIKIKATARLSAAGSALIIDQVLNSASASLQLSTNTVLYFCNST